MDDFDINLTKKFYDCYSLSLNDMQVIVGRIKDNWRLAHLAGTSNLHVLDKFSITLQCERRIVSSADPGNYFTRRLLLKKVLLPTIPGSKLAICPSYMSTAKNCVCVGGGPLFEKFKGGS
jgi:hypothetical protein